MSTHIFALCQAADLRTLEALFREKFFAVLRSETVEYIPGGPYDDEFFRVLTNRLIVLLNGSTDQDSATRFDSIMSDLSSTLIALLDNHPNSAEVSLKAVNQWHKSLAKHARAVFLETRESYVSHPNSAAKLLGRTGALYTYVREELGVKIHWGDSTKDTTAIGTEIGKIFHAWKSPRMTELLVNILEGPKGVNGVNHV